MGVNREDASLRIDRDQHVEHDRLFLLEGAGERDAVAEALEHGCDEFLGRELLGPCRQGGDVVVGRRSHGRKPTSVHNTS